MSAFTGNIGHEEEDGLGWGGLVPSAEERRAERHTLERSAKKHALMYAMPMTPPAMNQLRKLARDKNVTPAQMVELLIEQAVKREMELNQGVK